MARGADGWSAVELRGQIWLAAGLFVGLAGAVSAGSWILIGWLPGGYVAAYLSVLLSPARRIAVTLVYLTPVVAYVACAMTAAWRGADRVDAIVLGLCAALVPTVILLALQGWMLASPRLSASQRISARRSLRGCVKTPARRSGPSW